MLGSVLKIVIGIDGSREALHYCELWRCLKCHNMQGLVEDVLAQNKLSAYKMLLPSSSSFRRRRGGSSKNCRVTSPHFNGLTGREMPRRFAFAELSCQLKVGTHILLLEPLNSYRCHCQLYEHMSFG